MALSARLWLMVGISQDRQALGAGHRRSTPGRSGWRRRLRRIGRRRAVDHAGKAAEAGLRDLSQHQVVSGGPGVAAGLAGGLLAGQPQRALLVLVVDIPDP